MKFELKTENKDYEKSFSNFFKTVSVIIFIVIFCDIALKLGAISRDYQIESSCKLLTVEKSKSNFKRISRLSNLKSKQNIWDFCREVIK
tara:strand:+ start:41 stop:307 length:267 start_codon:yes stop_codon:yes gene_type:complete